MPYERNVLAERPHACRSRKNAATGPTTPLSASTSWYGSNKSPVATSDPYLGTTKHDRSRDASDAPVTRPDGSRVPHRTTPRHETPAQ